MIVLVHYLLLCAFLQGDDQLKSKLKIQIFTLEYRIYNWNPRASYVLGTEVMLADDRIQG